MLSKKPIVATSAVLFQLNADLEIQPIRHSPPAAPGGRNLPAGQDKGRIDNLHETQPNPQLPGGGLRRPITA
jgi:hypothetical protein